MNGVGAHFEISIDGKPRTYRDTKEGAGQAAAMLKKHEQRHDRARPPPGLAMPKRTPGLSADRAARCRCLPALAAITIVAVAGYFLTFSPLSVRSAEKI